MLTASIFQGSLGFKRQAWFFCRLKAPTRGRTKPRYLDKESSFTGLARHVELPAARHFSSGSFEILFGERS